MNQRIMKTLEENEQINQRITRTLEENDQRFARAIEENEQRFARTLEENNQMTQRITRTLEELKKEIEITTHREQEKDQLIEELTCIINAFRHLMKPMLACGGVRGETLRKFNLLWE